VIVYWIFGCVTTMLALVAPLAAQTAPHPRMARVIEGVRLGAPRAALSRDVPCDSPDTTGSMTCYPGRGIEIDILRDTIAVVYLVDRWPESPTDINAAWRDHWAARFRPLLGVPDSVRVVNGEEMVQAFYNEGGRRGRIAVVTVGFRMATTIVWCPRAILPSGLYEYDLTRCAR
jgi:hypothetical protein